MRISSALLALVGLGAGLPGCGKVVGGGGYFPDVPGAAGARCRVGASQSSLIVTEWAAAEKANLETLLAQGGVAVAFSGCELRVIPSCKLPGRYVWQRTTPGSDMLEISSEAELYAKVPVGAASLSGELRRSGSLYLLTTVSGQRRLEGASPAQVPVGPECSQATHVVSAMTVGAFVLSAGGSIGASASASALGVGEAGGKFTGSARLLRSAGVSEACPAATDEAPARDCASPLQVFLAPIPGRAEPDGPPGSVKVDFVSASATTRWDVYLDDQASCTTPCARWVDPTRPVVLRSREDRPSKLHISRLEPDLGPMQVVARPTSMGKLVTGITFTALGGLAVITGITLTAVGCSADEDDAFGDGMCTGGLITLAVGAVVTPASIWLMGRSRAKAFVRPIFGGPMAGGGGLVVGKSF